jgi:signal transduction histidine kinase
MKNTRFRILSRDGVVVICSLERDEIDLIPQIVNKSVLIKSNLRVGFSSFAKGSVYAFSNNKQLINSSRLFKRQLNIIAESYDLIEATLQKSRENEIKKTSRLFHNLLTLNGRNIQEIYSLVPQNDVSRRFNKQVPFVENIIRENTNEAAKTLLRIAKNNAAMKAEFSVFRKLYDENPNLSFQVHNAHKVLMNLAYLFFSDFIDKNVKVIVGDEGANILCDYDSIHVTLYHILDNASKYVKNNSEVSITILQEGNTTKLIFDMISLQISDEEKEKIFEEGHSGKLPSGLVKAGEGIGLSQAKHLLEMNRGSISLETFPNTIEHKMGISYQRNIFSLFLPTQKI